MVTIGTTVRLTKLRHPSGGKLYPVGAKGEVWSFLGNGMVSLIMDDGEPLTGTGPFLQCDVDEFEEA